MAQSAEKALQLKKLHDGKSAFIIPNPYDEGTARLLAGMGFEALATTGAGYAFVRGRPNASLTRDDMLGYVARIVEATDLPVSADLESGFGETVDKVAETYRLAIDVGLAGGSIEDTVYGNTNRLYDVAEAAARVEAAVDSVRASGVAFQLVARAENYLVGRPDIADVITRLQAYQEAGADVLYAPGLSTRNEIETLVRSVDRPVNVVMGLKGVQLSLAELDDIGVRRVSVGSALSRAALGAFMRAGREMRETGTFTFAQEAVSMGDISALMDEG